MTEQRPGPAQVGCGVCDILPPGDLIDLDIIMGDPARWPSSVWTFQKVPHGALTPPYRQWGAIEMGMRWLDQRGITVSRGAIRTHYRRHVAQVPTEPGDLIAIGVIAEGDDRTDRLPEKIDPLNFMRFYNAGQALGLRGVELMQKRIDQLIEEKKDVPFAMLKAVADLGAKLAISQAMIRASGKPFGLDEDEEEGFRAGADGVPSPRMGHSRIRKVGGKDRPVRDEGPADRAGYNDRAAEDGAELLPQR